MVRYARIPYLAQNVCFFPSFLIRWSNDWFLVHLAAVVLWSFFVGNTMSKSIEFSDLFVSEIERLVLLFFLLHIPK